MRLADEGYNDEEEPSSAGTSLAIDRLLLQEREELVYKLLASMPRAQIARIHRWIAPCVQMDIIEALPSEIALLVFSYLPWPTLLRCSLVSRRWRALADDNSLWKRLCAQRGWAWRWPSVRREPLRPLGDGVMDHNDEGMGDDEEVDASTSFALPVGSEQGAPVAQTVVCHRDPHVFGLPATPRINQHARAEGTRRRRGSSPAPLAMTVASNALGESSQHATNVLRYSSPSMLPTTRTQRPNYKLLHQTHVLLKNRLLHGSYRFSTLQTCETPNVHTSMIYCLQLYTYANDGRQVLFTGSKDSTVREWNLSTGAVDRVFEGVHTESVLSLCAHGNYLASGGSDLRVCIWDLRDGSLVTSFTDHQDSVLCVRFDSERLVTCSKDGTIRFYRFNYDSTKRILDEGTILGTHRAAINSVAFAGEFIVSVSGDKSLRVWDPRTGEKVHSFESHHTRGIATVDALGSLVMSGSSDKHIRIFDIKTRRGWSTAPEFHDPLSVRDSGPGVVDCAVCEVCGGTVTERRCSGAHSRRSGVPASDMHSDLVRSVAIGTEFVLSASYDKTIKVWDRETGSLVADLGGRHDYRIFGVGFDCTKIVSCGEDHKICIWDYSDGIDTSFLQL
ncbi:hypothetical protein M0805_002701 [Coniferiporia weirii]|nr:hypothetical protein M0805_002701 [Coniferiporia weirii]